MWCQFCTCFWCSVCSPKIGHKGFVGFYLNELLLPNLIYLFIYLFGSTVLSLRSGRSKCYYISTRFSAIFSNFFLTSLKKTLWNLWGCVSHFHLILSRVSCNIMHKCMQFLQKERQTYVCFNFVKFNLYSLTYQLHYSVFRGQKWIILRGALFLLVVAVPVLLVCQISSLCSWNLYNVHVNFGYLFSYLPPMVCKGIPVAQQHLIWNNLELDDEHCLHDYG